MTNRWLSTGAILMATAVALGAFGAHALAERLDARHLELWRTAAQYLALGGTALALVGLAGRSLQHSRALEAAGVLLLLGSLVFSGTVAALALGGPSWLGAVTPLGGVALIVGLLSLALAATKQPS